MRVRRPLLTRWTDRHGLVVGRECAGRRRTLEALARRRTIRARHSVSGRRRTVHTTVAGNSAWCSWETVGTAWALEARWLLELRRRRALRESIGTRTRRALSTRRKRRLLLARRTAELGRLLVRGLLLGCLLGLLLLLLLRRRAR